MDHPTPSLTAWIATDLAALVSLALFVAAIMHVSALVADVLVW